MATNEFIIPHTEAPVLVPEVPVTPELSPSAVLMARGALLVAARADAQAA